MALSSPFCLRPQIYANSVLSFGDFLATLVTPSDIFGRIDRIFLQMPLFVDGVTQTVVPGSLFGRTFDHHEIDMRIEAVLAKASQQAFKPSL